ncbi:OmpA family protein [Dyadobacter sp. CY326]|uniref:OmpA family protein n=1 Tax=Dyadobacter sp. CY326 TaxID=2907300 RepID=UPI001F34BCF5|nr:OmpA family protein [Dyadobacter sp. CY326]MCE7063897.1 OmpA family protein [Dyadobacter sp. CY326]
MAELDVQPKKKNPWWIWLIIAAVIIALILLVRGCDKAADGSENSRDSTETGDTTASITGAATLSDWDNVDFNASETSYDEVTDKSISVRGNANYAIYGLGENILFSVGDTSIQASAESQLKQISASLNKRFKGASLAVYGSTDSTGGAKMNKEIGESRANAVKHWLVENAGIAESTISVHSRGQSSPVASNATPEGRQMNRRVDIVARIQK